MHVFRALPPDRAICSVDATGAVCEVRLLQATVPEALYPAHIMRPLPAALDGLRWNAQAGVLEAASLRPI